MPKLSPQGFFGAMSFDNFPCLALRAVASSVCIGVCEANKTLSSSCIMTAKGATVVVAKRVVARTHHSVPHPA